MSHDGARWENLLQLELSENIFPSLQTPNRHTWERDEVPELLLNFTASSEKYWDNTIVLDPVRTCIIQWILKIISFLNLSGVVEHAGDPT